MITPCIGVCKIDQEICVSCKRTKKQIDNWSSYTPEERMEIMRTLGYGKRMGREERLRRYDRG
jgi:predicted Fe-S protein YdhL (DUF1289 family)